MKFKQIVLTIIGVVAIIILLVCAGSIFETVPMGSYQVKQAAVSGTVTSRMEPGLWMQNFGDIFTFPNSETFFFTADVKEGGPLDQSIEVTFADGSICNISGTARIMMPTTQAEAIHLTKELGFRTYHDIEQKLILPTVRRALVLTSTMMTAQESYNVKRPDFLKWAAGQIEHGIAATDEVEKEVKDPITGETSKKKFKEIRLDKNQQVVYESNPLEGTGIKLQNFEVKKFKYSPAVETQIAEQQKAIMGVATAKAEALKAEQSKITAEANGQAAVMTAKYTKEEEKIKAVVDAEKVKAVAILGGEQGKATAELDKQAAEFTKQKDILLGQGIAERQKLIMEANGALDQKLDAFKYGVKAMADAWSVRPVPAYYIEGGSGDGKGLDSQNAQFMNTINVMMANSLGLDLNIQKGTKKN